jgi:hypothetical protein
VKRLIPLLAFISLAVPALAQGASELPLTVVSETSTTITLSWTPPANATGYKFFANGALVANSQNGAKSQVKFGKVACDGQPDCYEVSVQTELARGGWKKKPLCSNGRDDDGDTKVDFPADPGCTDALDQDETDPAPTPQCADSKDNDGDGKVDAEDPGCTSATDNDESDGVTPTTITPTQCNARAAVAGAVIDTVTVSGGCTITAPNVTIRNSTLSAMVDIRPAASGARLLNSKSRGFELKGADDVLIEGNVFDGEGRTDNIEIYDEPAGNTPDRWTLRGNTFKNFYVNDGSTHSEALFIGYSRDGLIEGNTFTNNGNTGHIFFTWWGGVANPSTSYPRNICVRGNVFNNTWNAFYDVNFRAEIPTSSGIKVQPDASSTSPQFYGTC